MEIPKTENRNNETEQEAFEARQYTELNEINGNISQDDADAGYNEIDYLKSNANWDDIGVSGDLKLQLWQRGFKKPSRIQEMVIKLFQKDIKTDILAQSQNGSGKTLAFLVPTLMICKKTANAPVVANQVLSPLVVIFADTKELAIQTFKLLRLYSFDFLRPVLVLKETVDLDQSGNVMITTMGTFFNLLNKKMVQLEQLQLLVLDETDKLLSQDFGKAKYPLLVKRLSDKHANCKIAMFSATFPPQCLELIQSLGRKLTKIITQKQDIQLKNLTHYFMKCGRQGKLEFICHFFSEFSQQLLENSVIIFVNSKKFADIFSKRLGEKGHKCLVLTSDMDPDMRLLAMEDFRAGKVRVLITTNLLSRGIDNRKVSVVINLDIPFIYGSEPKEIDAETYLHRVGRTGRFGDKGIAINVVENPEDLAQLMRMKEEFGVNLLQMTIENFGSVINTTEVNAEYNSKKRDYFEENI